MWDYLMPCKKNKFAKSVEMDYILTAVVGNLKRGVQLLECEAQWKIFGLPHPLPVITTDW